MTGVSIGTAYAGCISGQRQRLAPANGVVGEAETAHHRRIIEIAAVEDQRRLQDLLEAIEIRAAELLPFRNDGQGVGPFRGLVGVLAQREALSIPIYPLGLPRRDRIVRAPPRARFQPQVDNGTTGRLA